MKGHSVRPAGCCKGGKMEKYVFSKKLLEFNNIKKYGETQGTLVNEHCECYTSLIDGLIAVHDEVCQVPEELSVYYVESNLKHRTIYRFICSINDCEIIEVK